MSKEIVKQNEATTAMLNEYLGTLPHDQQGRISWKELRNDNDDLKKVLEHAAELFVQGGSELVGKNLREMGYSSLLVVIAHDYQDGLIGLRNNIGLGEQNTKKPKGYWSTDEGQDEMRRIARILFEQHGAISSNVRKVPGLAGFDSAVSIFYPGGWIKLREDIQADIPRKPNGYWTPETIEAEARSFYEKHGKLTQKVLLERGYGQLVSALNNTSYPGGLIGLQIKLGITPSQKEDGYWTKEVMEDEALRFYQTYGAFNIPAMEQHGRKDLLIIRYKYPGGLFGIAAVLGIPMNKVPNGYWTPETIEAEARGFYEKYGKLSATMLSRKGKGALLGAIRDRYPNRMGGIKDKLGIPSRKKQESGENLIQLSDFLEVEDE